MKKVQANQLSFAPPLKPSETHIISDDFTGYRSQIIQTYQILSFKRPGHFYIFFDFGEGVFWRGVLNREGHFFKKT